MTDLYLRAESESVLAAALPMLREPDEAGRDVWAGGGDAAIDAGFLVLLLAAEVSADGAILREAEIEPGYHANLRILPSHPRADEIVAAAGPFRVEPATPQRRFAGEPVLLPVPDAISDRQFAQALAGQGMISRDAALAFVKRGEVPAALQAAIDAIRDPDQRFAVDMEISGATTFHRTHPTTAALAEVLGWSPAQMDDLWRAAGAL